MEIRRAEPGDVADLMELYSRHLTADPPREEQNPARWARLVEELAADPGYHLLVGVEDGRVVSSVTVVIIRNLTHNVRPYAVIENVVTHAAWRGRGYASRLMEKAVDIAGETGCYKVMLMTGSKKESTLEFYERCGFDRHTKTAFQKRL